MTLWFWCDELTWTPELDTWITDNKSKQQMIISQIVTSPEMTWVVQLISHFKNYLAGHGLDTLVPMPWIPAWIFSPSLGLPLPLHLKSSFISRPSPITFSHSVGGGMVLQLHFYIFSFQSVGLYSSFVLWYLDNSRSHEIHAPDSPTIRNVSKKETNETAKFLDKGSIKTTNLSFEFPMHGIRIR